MWGVRNGPPYPLDQKTHNRVRKQKNATVGIFREYGFTENPEELTEATMNLDNILYSRKR